MKEVVGLLTVAVAVIAWFYLERRSLLRRIEHVFAGRVPLPDHAFYEKYFSESDVPEDIPVGVRSAIQEEFQIDASRISDADDFSKNLRFLLEKDSLIDVAIVENLERRFGIKISDEEAENMKTVRDIVNAVHARLST